MQYDLKELISYEEMKAQYFLLQQLNPKLQQNDYETMLPDMIRNGYRQVVVLENGAVTGMSGFWINTKLYCGKYIEMDNVVTDAAHRNKGIGKILCDWITQKGRAEGCKHILLDAYVINRDAHRFYFREGFFIEGFHMNKKIAD
ncbi:GNAT family N-acetyltransferase [Chitinophaga barathri]|uniref:GNAT family N-acetyltransferase n=1 Tax=Chitinophaga barathri TaxID=1647451 RepID=A0A3N4M7T0_9BACT|nr:GNAT family N-acetyltransferase [Chitinophaga barathri]RPD39411.1 GNAT family N-acetyltransferase [Chitinophaga barathri]